MIRFICPNCETKLKASEDKAGTKITCPECREKVAVPSEEEGQEPAAQGKKGGAKSSGSNKVALIGVAGVAGVVVAGVAILLVMQNKDKTDTNKPDPNKSAQAAQSTSDTSVPPPGTNSSASVPPATTPTKLPTLPGTTNLTPPVTIPSAGTVAKGPPANKTPDGTSAEKKPDGQDVAILAGPEAKDVRDRLLKSITWIVTQLPKGVTISGSGTLIDRQNRLVLTNYHVISQAHKGKLRVFFPMKDPKGNYIFEKERYIRVLDRDGIPCHVLHQDTKRDLAIVQLVDLPAGVQTLPIAKKSVSGGDHIHVMGSPGASGSLWAYTPGSVKNVYHKKWIIPGHGKDDPTLDLDCRVVEHTAPVNAGDSGGPNVNDRKELIGVTQGGVNPLFASNVNVAIDVSEVWTVLNATYKNTAGLKRPKELDAPVEESTDVKTYVKKLKDRDPGERLKAAEVLGRFGPDARSAVPDLADTLLKDSDESVRKAVAESLQQIGSVPLSQLAKIRDALKDKNVDVRIAVIGILSVMGREAVEAVPDLLAALKDSDRVVRHKAALALGQLGPIAKAAVPDLAKALKDDSPDVRVAAAAGLAKMQQTAQPALKEIGEGLTDDNQDVRVSLLEAIKNIGPDAKDLVPALRKTLQVRDKETRLGAIEALGSIGDPAKEAVSELADLTEYKELRAAVTDTLVRIGKSAIPKLREKLRHPRKEVRLAAVQVLEKFGADAKPAVADLQALFRSPQSDQEMRDAINKALRKIL